MNVATESLAPVEPVSYLYQHPSAVVRIKWEDVFTTQQPVEVELGCGDAGFLIEYAGKHPERNFFGLERLLGRMRKLDKRARRRKLDNVRGFRLECGYTVKYLLPPESVSTFHIYFPDPWPKRRHHKRRLVNTEFPALAHQALALGGVIYLRTDHTGYFEQMLKVFQAHNGFRAGETPDELASVTTDFEKVFNAKGIPTLRAAFQKASAA